MTKQKFLDMGYKQLYYTKDSMDTLYKKFPNGNMWIIQFNSEVSNEAVGMVYLIKEQVNGIFKDFID